jgi:hypothetical protein
VRLLNAITMCWFDELVGAERVLASRRSSRTKTNARLIRR